VGEKPSGLGQVQRRFNVYIREEFLMSKSNNVSENPVTRSLQMTSDMLAKSTDMWQNYPVMLTKTCE